MRMIPALIKERVVHRQSPPAGPVGGEPIAQGGLRPPLTNGGEQPSDRPGRGLMHRLWRFLTATALVAGSLGAMAPTATAAGDDILTQLKAVPGLTVVAEQPAPAPYRFFVLNYTQQTDHRHPSAGTFQQRLTLL